MARFEVWLVAALTLLTACADAGPALEIGEEVGRSEEALVIQATSDAVAYDYAKRSELPHGIDGDSRSVFVTEPFAGRVVVLDRVFGVQRATLPPPPGGFILPFAVRVDDDARRVVVLDPGGFPDVDSFPTAKVHEYSYRYRYGRIEATLTRTISFEGIPTVFTEDLEILPNGDIVVTEAGIGALWVIDPSGAIFPGIFPASPAPEDAIPELAGCPLPSGVTVDGVPFELAGGFAPGTGSMTSDGTYLYLSGLCTGGLLRLPWSVFRDARAPFARADDFEMVSPMPAGKITEILKGLDINEYGDTNQLYASDALELQIVRIDLTTGEREVVMEDPYLFNFTAAGAFLPPHPLLGTTPYVGSGDQEHRLATLNVALEEDMLQMPFVIAKLHVVD